MKKILLICSILIGSLFLVSCGENKAKDNVVDNEPIQDQEQVQKQLETAEKINDEMKDDIKNISEKVKNGEMNDEEAKEAMLDSMNNSETIKSELEIQKEQMPKMLEIIKVSRKCFEDVNNKSEAKICIDKSIKLAKQLGVEELYSEDEEFDDNDWNQDEKEQLLVEMDEAIIQFEKMLPCIENAKVMSDMMKCNMGN